MSDLQISLLAAGALVVAGVYLFNVWQERSFRRKSEQAFAQKHEDVLMRSVEPDARPASPRTEPRLAPAAQQPADAADAVASAIDPVIDYVVEVQLPAETDGAELHEELVELAATWQKPVLVAGADAVSGEWLEAGRAGAGKCQQLRFAVQLVNRAGCITRSQLAAFREAVTQWSARAGGEATAPDVAEAHRMAEELDRFCTEVDVAIGVNVVSRHGASFAGARIRELAEAEGLRLEADGVFHYRADGGPTLFTLDNHEPMPFVPEQVKTITTHGITFLLDVPRIAEALAALETMVATARRFVEGLEGTLVDDNRAPLTDAGIEKIRSQLRALTGRMQAAEVVAGGPRALRLFS